MVRAARATLERLLVVSADDLTIGQARLDLIRAETA